jgi:hypothetical protein
MKKFTLCVIPMLMMIAPALYAKAQLNPSTDTFPLDEVIGQVKAALNDYQASALSADNLKLPPAKRLPKLKSAEFDFKTTNDTSVGLKFTFLIFTIGGSRSSENVNDVTFLYQVPTAASVKMQSHTPPRLLKDDLTKTIQAAATTLQNAQDLNDLPFQQLAITISYGVKWDVAGGVSVPMLITSGFNADKSRNAVQSVKLVFSNK